MFFSQSGRLLQSSVKLLQLSVRLWQSSVRLLQSTTRLLQSSVRLFQSSLLFSIPFSQSVRVCQSGINQYVNLTQEKDHEWFKKIKGQSGIGSQFTSPFSIRVKRCWWCGVVVESDYSVSSLSLLDIKKEKERRER